MPRLPARKLKIMGAAGLMAYVVLSIAAAFAITGPSTHPTRELFPFFTWSLFSRVNDTADEYRIVIITLDGQRFDPPADMRSIGVFPQFGDSSILAFKALQNLGRALLDDDGDDGKSQRERFAARFFGDHDVDYRINRHDYNPLRRWREGPSSDDVTEIGGFSHRSSS